MSDPVSPPSPWSECMLAAQAPTDGSPGAVTSQDSSPDTTSPRSRSCPRRRCMSVTFDDAVEEKNPSGPGATHSMTSLSGQTGKAEDFSEVPLQVQSSSLSLKSSSSAVCRICQLSEKEAGEGLRDTGCECRGSINQCHAECLWEWVRTRGSSTCEVCQQHFALLSQEQLTELRRMHIERSQVVRGPRRSRRRLGHGDPPVMCADNRRMWFCIIFVLLVFTVCSTASLTVYIKEDYQKTWREAYERGEVLDESVNDNYVFCYTLVIAILSFSVTMTLGVFVSWVMAECYFWPRERNTRIHLDLLHQLQFLPSPVSSDTNNNTIAREMTTTV